MRLRKLSVESLESRRLLAYGDVDSSFGISGKRTYAITEPVCSQDFANTAIVAKDGGIWIAGASENEGAIAKITNSGTLDTTFDQDGRARYTFNLAEGTRIDSMKELSDGSILVGGNLAYTGTGVPYIAKILSDGNLDASFADKGVWVGRTGMRISLVESPNDDIILLEKDASERRTLKFRFIKLAGNGEIDTQFGDSGETVPVVGHDGFTGSVVPRIAIADSGGIVLAFTEPSPFASPRFLRSFRYLPNGVLDSSYGTNGTGSIELKDTIPQTWLRLSDRQFLVGSIEFNQLNAGTPKIQKIDLLTGLVSSFGIQGELNFPKPSNMTASGLTFVQLETTSDGQLRASWTMMDNQSNRTLISSVFSMNGVLDLTYGTNGFASAVLQSNLFPSASTSKYQDATHIVGATGFPRDFGIVALDKSGKLNPEYGVNGEVKIDLTTPTTYVASFALSGNGSDQFSVLSQPGNRDDHSGGVETVNLLGETKMSHTLDGYYANSDMESYVSETGWTIVAKHSFINGAYKVVVNRIDPNGIRDSAGELSFDAPYFVDSFKFRETRDGNLFLVADTFGGGIGTAMLVKMTREGVLVSSYADGGVKRFVDLPDRLFDVIDTDAGTRLIITNPVDDNNNIQVIALNTNGDKRTDFGIGGIFKVFDTRRPGTVFDVIADGSGALLIAKIEGTFKLLRFNDQGLDLSFGLNGYKALTFSRQLGEFPAQIAQVRKSYDSIIVAATLGGPDSAVDISVFNKHGAPLTDFGTNGRVVLNPSSYDEHLADILPLRDGSILVGMSSQSSLGRNGLVMRLLGPTPSPRPYYYIRQPLNVSAADGDRSIDPLDVLLIVNFLNQPVSTPKGFVDTDGDGQITPLDVLLIINFLNRSKGSGEGESSIVAASGVGMDDLGDGFAINPKLRRARTQLKL